MEERIECVICGRHLSEDEFQSTFVMDPICRSCMRESVGAVDQAVLGPTTVEYEFKKTPTKRTRTYKVGAGLTKTEWQAEWRKQNPDYDKTQQRAKNAALRRLSELHAEEYERLHNEERDKLGLPPVKKRTRKKR